MLAVTTQRAKFAVKGYDQSRGGALKLEDKWL
jgi:hypothetical protein